MVFKDTELDTQGSDKQQSLDERQKQWMELGLEEKMARKETEISREAIDNEPALVIAEMAKYVGEECPHLVQIFEETKRMQLSDKHLSSLAADIDIRLNKTRPEELHEIAGEIKDNYDTWAEGRAAPPIGSRGPRGDGYKTQYLYESMMGNGLPKEFFDKMAVASVHFNYVYHPDSPQSQIYQQMRLNSGRVSDIDELQEQTLRIADESLYDAVKLVIGKKEHVIRGVFCETDNYYPQLVTRMITTLEVDKGLPQGVLLERVNMDDLFHRIKEDLGPRTSTRLSRY